MSVIKELQRRNVFRIAIAYIAASWLLVQLLQELSAVLGLSAELGNTIAIILAIGFIPALGVSWVFELTPDGWEMESDIDQSQTDHKDSKKRFDMVVVVMLLLGLVLYIL